MNNKKLVISLTILAVLLLAALIVYLCFFGKAKDPDDSNKKVNPVEGVDYSYMDQDDNIVTGPISYKTEEEKAADEAAAKKAQEDNTAAAAVISDNLTFPDEFVVEDVKAEVNDNGEAGTIVKFSLLSGTTRLAYTIDREPEANDFSNLPKKMTHEVKTVEGISVDMVSDDEGCILYWTDASGSSHKLAVPYDGASVNASKALEWAGLLIGNGIKK